jgi:CheY-like chemotaxis protein
VNILDFSSKHLLSLISDVLDFSKIETGKIEFEKNSFDIRHLTNNIYKLFKARADEKRIDFKFSPAADVTTSLYGDNLRLGQILTNLLGNAIKFTNNGYVHFGYKVISNNASHITFEFFIKDTGIGMDEEEQRRIFESFSQANVKVSREYGGTGLGLTISKKLIDMQGGSISVVSRKNVGSTFSFVITYEKHAFVSSLPQPSTKKMVSQNLQGLKVLVAEDNKINSFVLQKFLNIWNVEVQFAVTGVEALRFVQEDDFDLILMDLQMPELDGQQATTAIRALEDKKINRIPIVALTADASVSTQELLLHNGFNHFITKPFNPDALYRILKKYYNVN